MKTLHSMISRVEIPASNLERAQAFYEALFDIRMEPMTLQNGLKMALFPVEKGGVGGALCEHEDYYHPGHQGPLLYLSANPDLQKVLERVNNNGGAVVVPKTRISEEYGFMAVFEDCEGNRIALHSDS